ncbi:MAG: sensor signal transduction histidine kinase, partial [Segetibacter sp.]|nr:sensor signal transduction histidine kinase [Segetibacter sp.]
IKFSKENSDIIIQTERKENNILISFIDRGLGMADETVKNIREGNFLTSSFGTKGEKGAGLGLSLCKDFIEKNNGSFHINSVVNVGSNFSYTLPLIV